ASDFISLLSVIALALTLLLVTTITGGKHISFSGMFVADQFAVFFKCLILIASALSIVIAKQFQAGHGIARFEYAILILFATLGMMLMISANDLISLYMGLELQSLSLYVLAAFQRDDSRSSEAGLKYFVLGALASAMLLYGSSLIYGFAGTTNFDTLASLFHTPGAHGPSVGLIIGIVFILAGLAFKVSAVPFHMWTPDVYEGAPTPVTAFFSTAPKLAAMALFIRVMIGPFGDLVQHWQQIVVFVSIASMLLGAFGAIMQKNIKRLMAYSSIGHVGYGLIGLAVGNQLGVRSLIIYMAIYLFMNLGAFACILTMRRGGRMVENIDDLAGFAKTHPMVACAMTIFMFSMAGIPPLAGFIGKLYIFMAAVDSGLYALAIIGVLTSVVGAFYYLRVIKVMYFEKPGDSLDSPISRDIGAVILGAGLVILLLIFYPDPIISSAGAAAEALFSG
ncbi:MAG: NADH-quinone oxidoreductase subunit NuoN, partial [Rhodospirillales bacterium]|nr:NADH-quinone oxidoreductase subunit NuoN [Rhodospirillales bacterium]